MNATCSHNKYKRLVSSVCDNLWHKTHCTMHGRITCQPNLENLYFLHKQLGKWPTNMKLAFIFLSWNKIFIFIHPTLLKFISHMEYWVLSPSALNYHLGKSNCWFTCPWLFSDIYGYFFFVHQHLREGNTRHWPCRGVTTSFTTGGIAMKPKCKQKIYKI